MALVLLVSRNSALGLALSTSDYDVEEARPDPDDRWLTAAARADAVALDLDDPGAVADAVARLRSGGHGTPVLALSGGDPGWASFADATPPGVTLLALPITRPALLASLETLIEAGPAAAPAGAAASAEPAPQPQAVEAVPPAPPAPPVEVEADPPTPAAPRPAPEAPSADPAVVEVDPLTSPVELLVPSAWPDELAQPAAGTLGAAGLEPAAVVRVQPTAVQPQPAAPPPEPIAATAELAAGALLTEPAPRPQLADLRVERPAAGAPADGLITLVRRLSAALHQLSGVPDTAEVVLAEAATRTGSTGGALFVPDGDSWRVAAGLGLRQLELRVRLETASWIVGEVATGRHGVIVEHTDIARDRLRGVPLASWEHLLAVPIPAVRGALLLASPDTPYDESALATAVAIAEEAGGLLADAIDVRLLARRLAAHRDLPD